MKLAFHTSCSGAKNYGFSNWHYLTRLLTAVRANSLRLAGTEPGEDADKVPGVDNLLSPEQGKANRIFLGYRRED